MLASPRSPHDKARLSPEAFGFGDDALRVTAVVLRRFLLALRAFPTIQLRPLVILALAGVCLIFPAAAARAQQTPIEHQITNPLTDTPNVNPLQQSQPARPRLPAAGATAQGGENLTLDCTKQTSSGPKDAQVFVCEGNVDARIGTYRLQADKVTLYEATNKVIAEGNVVFDQGDQQRITGSRAEWNYKTKTGFFLNSTGFTNQTQDGTRLYFTADRIERISLDTIIAENADVTACEEEVPKWSFHAKRVKIKTGDRVRMISPVMRVKRLPVMYLPYASVSLKRQDRASGFLTPTFGGSGAKGFRISEAYYQTLGRSADATLRADLYSKRGIGFGAELRTRANSRSFLNAGFYAVKDRILGPKADAAHPDQGGSSFFIDAVHYFPNGFLAVADVNITSSLAFRQVFSDSIQQAISPDERSLVFVTKNYHDYSFNFRMNSQVTSLLDSRIRIRELPSVTLDKRPSPLPWFKQVPVYFSFEGGAEGVSRKETTADLVKFRILAGRDPITTPSIVQRFDFHPQLEIPLDFDGWTLTTTLGGRATYYSSSFDPATKLILSRDVVRGYGELELDLRPPALAKNFRAKDGSVRFRHVVEPYLIYRRIAGLDNFDRIIRFDYVDAVADTNEIEFGLSNRFYTRRSTESVTGKATGQTKDGKATLSTQPYEALTITVRGKYFIDPTFGGALKPGQRNQFYPVNTFSGFSYGGVPRRFSPVNIEVRYRPTRNLSADFRSDIDTHGGGLRAMAATLELRRNIVQAFSTFYYTRSVDLVPSLARYALASGKEPGTLRGSQWSPQLFIGNPERGVFGGVALFFDFQRHPFAGNRSLISSTTTVGYAWNCCAITVQDFTFNVGARNENRIVFAFRLNGIGTFGTEKIGQRF